MKIETRAVHAGRHIDPATGAVTPPIHLSTTFERAPDGEYPTGFSYSREDNPNRRALEECLAALEGGTEALAFSSGHLTDCANAQLTNRVRTMNRRFIVSGKRVLVRTYRVAGGSVKRACRRLRAEGSASNVILVPDPLTVGAHIESRFCQSGLPQKSSR